MAKPSNDLGIALRRDVLLWRHGSIEALAAEAKISRATLYRWLRSEGLPSRSGLLKLARALDVDPFALFDFRGRPPIEAARELATTLLSRGQLGTAAGMAWLLGRYLFSPGEEWPSETVFGRRWQRAVVRHDASRRRDYWGLLPVTFPGETSRPQAWHFAFRSLKRGRGGGWWIPYGIAVAVGCSVRLVHFDGDAQERACPDGRFVVETWFGAGSADFCVASLHAFELRDPDVIADDWPRVRFGELEETPAAAGNDG